MHGISFGRIFVAVILVAAPGLCISARGDDEPAHWRKAEAGRYLDERAQAWFAFADAGRGEAETKSRCVSCHTVSPFALARPALRKLTGAKEPTEIEKRLIVQTKMRVEHWDELDSAKFQLLYDFDEPKKRESWGTESVLNAAILAFDDHYQGRPTPGDATKRALANMWQAQSAEGSQKGSWDWLNFGLEPWESPSARYFGLRHWRQSPWGRPRVTTLQALIPTSTRRCACSRDISSIISGSRTPSTESGSCGLPTDSAACSQRKTGKPWSENCLTGSKPTAAGDWLPWAPLRGATVLPRTRRATVTRPGSCSTCCRRQVSQRDDPKIARGLDWLRANQEPSGEWRASSVNKKRDPATQVGRLMSDSATAFAILALSH